MEVMWGNGVASALPSRAAPTTLAVVLLSAAAAACGGRAVPGPLDAGVRDGSADADACDDAICDPRNPDCCGRCIGSRLECPPIAPFCCGDGRNCLREPVEYPEGSYEGCSETLLEGSFVEMDCHGDGRLDPDLCPAEFPYCCAYFETVCADHPIVGHNCKPDQ